MNDRTEPEKILAVGAHPDDLEYECGGSLIRWSREGATVCLVICTNGEKGISDPELDPGDIANRRRSEQQQAAQVLGAEQTTFLDVPDGELNTHSEPVRDLTAIIRQEQPDRLVCWDPWARYQIHPDHRAAGRHAMNAVVAAGNPRYYPQLRSTDLEAHPVPDIYLYGSDEPDVQVNVTDTIDQKVQAVMCHESQIDDPEQLRTTLENCASSASSDCAYPFAEAFKELHPHQDP